MSETGYEAVRCKVQIDLKCKKRGGNPDAGYSRRPQFAQQGPWLDACEACARVPYEQPAQFKTEDTSVGF
jgi:hypothetical protein